MAWLVLGEQVARLKLAHQRFAFSAAMMVATLASMAMSFQLSPGVFFDFRSPLIAVSALFGGAPAAFLVGGTALAYRLWLGGALFAGILSIGTALFVGMVSHRLCRKIGWVELAVLAIAISLNNLLVPFALPAAARLALQPHIWTPVALSALCTLLVGGLLVLESRRRELAAANLHFRAMVEALPDCLNIKDGEGRFIAANEATAKLMRAPSAATLIGKTDFDFYPTALAARFRADEERILSAGQHQVIEQEPIFDDGMQAWLSTLKTPVFDRSGRTVGLVTHNRDITATKLIQAKLAETQSYLDQALAYMGDGLAMYDAQGTLLFCNRRYHDSFPLTSHLRVPGSNFDQIIQAAVTLGEEALEPGLTVEQHIAKKRERLSENGEHVISLTNGKVFACRTTIVENGCSLRIMSDVTERATFESHLKRQALHDALTGLPNRTHFNREFARLLGKSQSEGGELVVMLVDLDYFKQVNDTFGHPTGDALLVEVSRRLERSVRQGDIVARLGGDEFAVLAYGVTGAGDMGLADRVSRNLSKPMSVDEVTLMPSGTIGYTVYPHDRSDAEGLLKNADLALYRAKARRRGSSKRWDPGDVATGMPVAQAG